MKLGLRSLLLVAGVVFFVIAIFTNGPHWPDWIAAGLACTSGAVLIREMGWDRSLMGGSGHSH